MSVAPNVPPPKADPESLALRAQPQPVVRLNRRILAVGCSILTLAVLGATFYSLKPYKRERGAGTELHNVDRVSPVESLGTLPKDYTKVQQPPRGDVPVLGKPLPGDLGPAILNEERRVQANASGATEDAMNERILQLRESEEAAKSPVFFRTSGNIGKAAAAAEKQRSTESLDDSPGTGQAPNAGEGAGRVDSAASTFSPDGELRNVSSLEAPRSPYQVMAGTIIPAALVTGINSDLPGQVIASVTQPVYDTATGHHLLIPQGSRLIGRYDSQVAHGQRRVLLVWIRLVMPDTSSIALDRLPGIDPAGYAGLEDQVNWHWGRVLAGAALSTLVGVGAELATTSAQTDSNRIVIASRDGIQDTANQVGQEITKRNANVKPTLTVRPGYLLAVMVNKDLVLRPYQARASHGGSLQ